MLSTIALVAALAASESPAQASRAADGPSVMAPGGGDAGSGGGRVFVAVPGEMEFTGELIVRPRQDLSAKDRARAVAAVAPMARRHYAETDEFMVVAAAGPEIAGAPEQRVADALMATGLFQYAHPNWLVFPVALPNDGFYGNQWHHTMMESPAAWDLHTGSPSVIAAVTDTGIVAHEDLPNRVPGYNSVSGVPEANGGDLTDIHGHGTHVAGCAAARGNNAVGVSGVGWNLSIMPIRVSEAPNGGASYESIMNGARWAIENGAVTASASYSGIGYQAIETTGEYIRSLNGSFLWAAGNSADDHAGWDFDHVLVIGASDQNDQRSGFSSFGRGVDCFAPGSSILSTINNGGYGYASGTSMATPVANGVLAMIRSANPALSAEHAEYILLRTCDVWGGEQDNEQFGFGRVNLRRAVSEALNALVPQAPQGRNDRAKGVTGQVYVLDVLNNDYDPNMDALEVLSVPAVSSLGDPLVILPGGGPGGRDAVRMTVAAGAAPGTRSFVYTLREPVSGATAQATAFVDASAPQPASNPYGTQPGVRVRYYELPALSVLPNWALFTPYATEVVSAIDYASTDGEFAGSGRADQVGAVYEGWLSIPQAGLWTLSTQSDDGSKLFLNGALVVDNDGLHGMQTRQGIVALAAGKHRLRVEFFENGGGAGLLVRWSGPGRSTQVIPASALSRDEQASPADLNGDGVVNGGDLGMLLAAWGSTGGPADLDGDGVVSGGDLGMLLSLWG